MSSGPRIDAVVVHWHNEVELQRLISAWPDDPRFTLSVVDNSRSALPAPGRPIRWLRPQSNVGFGGGANLALEGGTAPWILLLNPDTRIDADALVGLDDVASTWIEEHPNLAMIAPRLVDQKGEAHQFGWQLRPLPTPADLLAQCWFLPRPRGPREEPPERATVEQPAAAALLLRRDALEEVGGFDPRFAPAWFEDVDLAQRFSDAGFQGRYARSVEVVHVGGASVSPLGFRRFLRIYYRNLVRYARAREWHDTARTARLLLVVTSLLRLPTLLVRRPRNAASRRAAAVALLALAGSALRGFPEAGDEP